MFPNYLENKYTGFRARCPLPCTKLYQLSLACCAALLFVAVFYVIHRSPQSEDSFYWKLDGFRRNPYLIDTPNCRVYNTRLLREDGGAMVHPRDVVKCPQVPPLSKVRRTDGSNRSQVYMLQLLRGNFPLYVAPSSGDVTCCFKYIRKDQRNNVIGVDPVHMNCTDFDREVPLDPSFELVEVLCHTNRSQIYKKFHPLLTKKLEVGQKRDFKKEQLQNDQFSETDRFSVMVIGFGSTSRLDFMKMPASVQFLDAQGWLPLEGHSAVGVGPRENLKAAVLAGLTADQFDTNSTGHDACPTLWEKFSDKGYITAYGETTDDGEMFRSLGVPACSTVNYYFSPLIADPWNTSEAYCNMGVREQAVLDYSTEFMTAFINVPTFSVFWLSSISRLDPSLVDELLRKYLENLSHAGVLNRTLIVLMSDQGKPYGDDRLEPMGFTESNLPFLYFWVPGGFRESHPSEVKHLEENRNKLTSPFDLHLTLVDIVRGTDLAQGCPSCASLFKPVPWTRTCAEAGIPRRFCSCLPYVAEPDATLSSHLGERLVGEINKRVNGFQAQTGRTCSNLTLETASLRWTFPFAYSRQFPVVTTKLYLLTVRTIPRSAFEAMLFFNETWEFDRILRLDDFRAANHCGQGKQMEFCVCRESSHGKHRSLPDNMTSKV